jgi:hypothetical protein
MTGQIADIWQLKHDIKLVLLKHLTGKCAEHSKKALEWVRPNITTFVESVDRDLDRFARDVIPVGEKLDAELEANKHGKGK